MFRAENELSRHSEHVQETRTNHAFIVTPGDPDRGKKREAARYDETRTEGKNEKRRDNDETAGI